MKIEFNGSIITEILYQCVKQWLGHKINISWIFILRGWVILEQKMIIITLFHICYHKESLYISHFHSCSAIRYVKLFMGVVNQANWIVFITFWAIYEHKMITFGTWALNDHFLLKIRSLSTITISFLLQYLSNL